MINSEKKIKKIVVEYEDGTIEAIRRPKGMTALIKDNTDNYRSLYHATEEDINEDDEVSVEVSYINCEEDDVYCCIEAIMQLADDGTDSDFMY